MTIRAVRPLTFLAAVLLAAPLAQSRSATAQAFAPAGFSGAGYFNRVWFDAAHPGTVWAASDVAGVFRSTDAGDSWTFRGHGLGNLEVDSFAIDPFDSSHLWAGCGAFAEGSKAGIYVSSDAGLSWAQLPASKSAGISFRRFSNTDALAPDPAARGTLLSGSLRNGVFRSTDGGSSFAQVLAAPTTSAAATIEDPNEPRPAPPYAAPAAQVLFDPSVPGTVYAAFDGAGVFSSASRGTAGTWQPVSTGLPTQATVKGLSFGSGALWAAVGRQGVYRLASGGGWTAASGDLPLSDPVQPWVSGVSADPSDPRKAFITLVTYIFRSVWKTTDAGATWRTIENVRHDEVHNPTRAWATWSTWPFSITRDPALPTRLFMTDYWSIHRSDDGGESWDEKVAGAQNTCVGAILPAPGGASGAVLVGVWDAGILRTTDAGATWAATRLGEGYVDNHAFRLASGGAGRTFATFDPEDASYVLLSTDGGLSWGRVHSTPHPQEGGMFVGLAVHPANPSTLYVSQENGSVWRSTQAGMNGSFVRTPGQPPDASFTPALAVDQEGRVFAGTRRGGLFRSTDGGASWGQVLSEEGTVWDVAATAGAVFAAGGSSNLHKSTDGGTTWRQLTSFVAPEDGDGASDQGMAIAVDPSDPRHILFGRVDPWHPADAGPGLFESTDGGAAWAAANDGLGITRVSTLAFGPDGAVWAGTTCGGTWLRRLSPGGSCTLACTATVPSSGTTGSPVAFSLAVAPSGCAAGTPAITWSFGDGGSSAAASTSHAYAVAGTYRWSVTASLSGATCTSSGSIAISAPVPPAATWLLPSSAHSSGANGAFYTTDLAVSNTGPSGGAFTVKFLGHDADGRSGPEATFPIGAGRTSVLLDVLGSVFGVSSGYGALLVKANVTTLALAGQTSTPAPPSVGGTFGQSVPAAGSASWVAAGSSRSITGIREDAAFRTNLVLANGSESPMDVSVTLVLGDGTSAGTKSYHLEPLGMHQASRVVRDLGYAPDASGARVILTPATGGLSAYASAIDNLTNDPRTLLPQ